MTNIGGGLLGSFMPGGGGTGDSFDFTLVHAQAQSRILQKYNQHAQAQALIKTTYPQHAQAQASIGNLYHGLAQAQALILQVYYVHGQAQADVLQVYNQHAQAQSLIGVRLSVHAQAQATILATVNAHGQAQANILQIYNQHGQAQASISGSVLVHGQAQAQIKTTNNVFGQAAAWIDNPYDISLWDTFTRSVSGGGGVGSPDIGAYESGASFLGAGSSIDGSRLRTGVSGAFLEQVNTASLRDIHAYFEFEPSGQFTAGLYLRVATQPFTYAKYLRITPAFTSGPTHEIRVSWEDGVTSYDLPNTPVSTFVPNTKYALRALLIGNRLRVKVWALGSVEPSTWLIDASSITFPVSGFSALEPIVLTGTTLYIDNLFIGELQPKGFGQAQAYIDQPAPIKHAQAQALITNFQGFGQAQARIIKLTDKLVDAETYDLAPNSTVKFFNNTSTYGYDFDDPSPFNQAPGQWIEDYGDPNDPDPPNGWLYFTLSEPALVTVSTTLLSPDNDTALAIYTGNSSYENGFVLLQRADTSVAETLITSLGAGTYLLFGGLWSYSDNFDMEITITIAPALKQAFAQARATIVGVARKTGQARATIIIGTRYSAHGQALAYINKYAFAQAQAWIKTDKAFAQAQAWITRKEGYAHAQARIRVHDNESIGQAQAFIEQHHRWFGQAQATITANPLRHAFGQAQTLIIRTEGYGQALALIRTEIYKFAQAQSSIRPRVGLGQAQADIKAIRRAHGLARAFIGNRVGTGQAQAKIIGSETKGFGQAQTFIVHATRGYGLARAFISKSTATGQAAARINALGQRVYGNAQARILAKVITNAPAQAQAYIKGPAFGQAQALIDSVRYLVKYNEYHFPGYAQLEDFDSVIRDIPHIVPFEDGSDSENDGLQNKNIVVDMKVLGTTYSEVKTQAQRAGTILRSARGYEKLYVGFTDRYYTAMGKSITVEKNVKESMKVLDYKLTFEAKPWLTSDAEYEFTGSGLIETTGRTLADGGYTPATVYITGTNVTVSGYTNTVPLTGYISVSGVANNLVIDSDAYTASMGGNNANAIMYNPDYRMEVGPGITKFAVTGATMVTIKFRKRWYL